AGEMVSLSLSLRAQQSLDEVVIDVGDLQRDGGRPGIAADALDVFVVREWEQAGLGVYQSERVRVAELLLKDADADLRDGYGGRCPHWRHWGRRGPFYTPPDVRLRGAARTALTARRPQQVWVALRVPATAAPGMYRGELHVEARRP